LFGRLPPCPVCKTRGLIFYGEEYECCSKHAGMNLPVATAYGTVQKTCLRVRVGVAGFTLVLVNRQSIGCHSLYPQGQASFGT
jgi:hypothetical protein